jgi:hypothetical protein
LICRSGENRKGKKRIRAVVESQMNALGALIALENTTIFVQRIT